MTITMIRGPRSLDCFEYINHAGSMSESPLTSTADTSPELLDHAEELVRVVMAEAPRVFQHLSVAPGLRGLLEGAGDMNHGQVFVWAQYLVFRREFNRRFPDAADAACRNAFCRLLLKNDISMSRLEGWMEKSLVLDAEIRKLL